MTVAEEWLRTKAVVTVIVNCGLHRAEAHQFYTELGYRQTGLRFVRGTTYASSSSS